MGNVARGSASSPMTARAFLKKMFCLGSVLGFAVLLPSAAMAGSIPATRGTGQCPCRCPDGRTVWINKSCGNESDCYGPCGITNSPSSTPSGRDYGAEQRAREEAAEAARLAEEQRRREAELEQQRRDADEKRRQEEIEKQAEFIRERNRSANTLRSSTGLRATPNTPGGTPLRGSTVDTGIRDLKPSREVRDPGGKQAAWKQLHCAVSISGYALGALDKMGDYQEFGTLSVEALKALDGGRPGVECPAAPPMPDLQGRSVDMERLKGEERKILERAAVIAERMRQAKEKSTNPSAPSPVPTNETEMGKKVRVQKELNEINSRKIYGNQKEIDEQEKNRKELAKLILENEKLTSVTFGTSEETPPGRRRKPVEPPSPEAAK